MALGPIGPLTTLIEVAATAVGAGIVLCSAGAGIWALARVRSRHDVEYRALMGGYLGGGVGAVAAVVDAILRYGV